MSSGSSGHSPGVDFLPDEAQEEVEIQVPLREPTLQVLGDGAAVQHWEKESQCFESSGDWGRDWYLDVIRIIRAFSRRGFLARGRARSGGDAGAV